MVGRDFHPPEGGSAMTQHHFHKLTERQIGALSADGLYSDGGNLFVQVRGASKTWVFRFVSPTTGARRAMGLGSVHTVAKELARDRARELRLQVQAGKDPIDEQTKLRHEAELARAKELTFRQVAQEWLDAKDAQWERQTAVNIRRQLENYVFPRIGELSIRLLDMRRPDNSAVNLVFGILKPIWQTKTATAKNLLWILEGILSYARASNLIAGDNAADIKGPLGHKLPKIESFYIPKRHAALPHQEIAKFVAELRSYTSPKLVGPVSKKFKCSICERPDVEEINKARNLGASGADLARKFNANLPDMERHLAHTNKPDKRPIASWCLEFLILTAVRREQATSAKWAEIDLEAKVWRCTEHKSKKKTQQDYVVPLSNQALDILYAMKKRQDLRGQKSEYVFVQDGLDVRPLSPVTINAHMKKSLKRRDCTPHGFRSTFGEWSVEHGYDERDSEMALGHVVGNSVRNIYKRNAERIEQRRLMMQAWADYCGRTEPVPAEVILFRQAKVRK